MARTNDVRLVVLGTRAAGCVMFAGCEGQVMLGTEPGSGPDANVHPKARPVELRVEYFETQE